MACLSRLTFGWLDGLLRLGKRRPLEASDLPPVPNQNSCSVVVGEFVELWERECNEKKESSHVRISIARMVRRSRAGRRFALAALLKIPDDVLHFVGPVIIKLMVEYLQKHETQPVWHGFLYAGLLLVCPILQSFASQQFYNVVYTASMDVQGALSFLVINKLMRLSPAVKPKYTEGEILNFMSVDSEAVAGIIPHLHDVVWSMPLQLVLCGILLAHFLDTVTAVSCLGSLAVLIPFAKMITDFTSKYYDAAMKLNDERAKYVAETLQGIRMLKMFCWEMPYAKRITDVRRKEQKVLFKAAVIEAFSWLLSATAPVAVTFGMVLLYSHRHGTITAAQLLPALSVLNIAKFPIMMLPHFMYVAVQANVSSRRLREFLECEEILCISEPHMKASKAAVNISEWESDCDEETPFMANPNRWLSDGVPRHPADPTLAVEMVGASFARQREAEEAVLKEVTLCLPKGALVTVVGSVGSGKSSLLRAILGELELTGGTVGVTGSIAYCAQQPWIRKLSLRDNIVADQPWDEAWYKKVVKACSLDIDNLGDKVIGDRGLTLSGGQKARVALARAVYRKCDVYLLDGVLAAVDAHVEAHILSECLHGLLEGKTRIVVHHRPIPTADYTVEMQHGTVTSFEALGSSSASPKDSEHVDESDGDEVEAGGATLKSGEEQVDEGEKDRKVGSVSWDVYWSFLKSCGVGRVAVAGILAVVYQSILVLMDFVLTSATKEGARYSVYTYLYAYGVLAAPMAICDLAHSITWSSAWYRGVTRLHNRAVHAVIRAPAAHFDRTSDGSILNRLTKDISTVDNGLFQTGVELVGCFLNTLAVVAVIGIVTPWFLAALPALMFLYYLIQKYYRCTAREVKRLESMLHTPVFSHFGEVIAGLETVRAHGMQHSVLEENIAVLSLSLRAQWVSSMLELWLQLRLEILGAVVVGLAALSAVLMRHSIDPSFAGLAIVYALDFTLAFNWMVHLSVQVETDLTSVERVVSLGSLPDEGVLDMPPPVGTPHDWPAEGSVELRNVHLWYKDNLHALKGITMAIQGGQRVGIVGRT
eukprot:Sspe_Gene.22459::Locus_8550_Transcript_1_1_Confidence_1.000_Length_3182::g.22459::m.22459/K05665/ABCC1; ATP-binding cassette, subfamily C (CFTR/MRP), member 1